MFHTYVLNCHSIPIDLDRATFLMDKAIWSSVVDELKENGEKDPQTYFCEYCDRHEEKYGKPFDPMVMKEPL